ncbi:MAG: flagellar basal body P-ring formation protein FlgA [Exiguobacterium profundum]|nr:MAG: flagellar basal body P-ring formation protein FlgA [Exiguobacterium profundum]
MRTLTLALIALLIPTGLAAESVVAARVIRARTVIAPEDLLLVDRDLPGALTLPQEAEGMEAKKTIYAYRPVRPEDLVPPAMIERNQTVVLVYTLGGLAIETEGRALDRAAVGDTLRVMNAGSRAVLTGVVAADGTVHILPGS